jgi:hypothetical protein
MDSLATKFKQLSLCTEPVKKAVAGIEEEQKPDNSKKIGLIIQKQHDIRIKLTGRLAKLYKDTKLLKKRHDQT